MSITTVDRLYPGGGAAPERPAHGPVASLGVGLERLRQLGWVRSRHYDEAYGRLGMVLIVLPVALLMVYMVFDDMLDLSPVLCVPLLMVISLTLFVVYYRTWVLARRTQGMLTRRVTAPRGSELRMEAEVAMTAVGFQHKWVGPSEGDTLSVHMVTGAYHVYRLPELSAELLVGSHADTRDEVTATTMLLGPVTADNVGGAVRLAEVLDTQLRGRPV